jgi:hypothetical protein
MRAAPLNALNFEAEEKSSLTWEYSLSFAITLDDESRHPLSEPAQWVAT